MQFWKLALRYHAPATIAGFIFFYLVRGLLEKDSFLSENPVLAIAFLVVITNFCAFLLYRSTEKNSTPPVSKIEIKENELSENEIGGELNLSAPVQAGSQQGVSIQKNKLTKNKIEGDVTLGVVTKHE